MGADRLARARGELLHTLVFGEALLQVPAGAARRAQVRFVLDEEGVADAIEVEQVSEESDWDFTDLALVRVEDE